MVTGSCKSLVQCYGTHIRAVNTEQTHMQTTREKMDNMVSLHLVLDLASVSIPRSSKVIVVLGQLAGLQVDVLPSDTMNVQTTYGELVDDVHALKLQLSEGGAMTRRLMRMRCKMLGSRIKAAAADKCACAVGMWNGVLEDAQKLVELSTYCYEYAELEHVLYKKPIALVLKEDIPAEVTAVLDAWANQACAMRAISDASGKVAH